MSAPEPGTRVLYDRESAAVQLSCSPRMIDELRRAGVLAAVQMGRTYKYRHADLEAYADSLEASA